MGTCFTDLCPLEFQYDRSYGNFMELNKLLSAHMNNNIRDLKWWIDISHKFHKRHGANKFVNGVGFLLAFYPYSSPI